MISHSEITEEVRRAIGRDILQDTMMKVTREVHGWTLRGKIPNLEYVQGKEGK